MFSVVYTALASHRDLLEIQRGKQQATQLVTELERSNRELEQFAYIASHDLQAPLRSISGFATLLERKLESVLDDEAREYLKFILGSTGQMRQLVEALLNLSRVGRGGVQLGEHSLTDIVAHARQRLSAVIEERNAVLEVDELPVVRCDRTMMVQLIQNLVGNGIKFQQRNPPLVQVRGSRGDSEWVISVQDHGIGIKPEHFEGIFKIFHRLHSSEEFEGSGIGLAICEKIVHMHGGRIWVDSEFGKGATFHFSLPDAAKGPVQQVV
jgi:light-regulated signal transduction histidine kinase (bacteriophytochrome)